MPPRCISTLICMSIVIFALDSEKTSIRAASASGQVSNGSSKGHMLLIFHFAALRFDKLSHDDREMRAFKEGVAQRLEAAIKAAAVANGTEFTKSKVVVTDVAVSDPSWDYDDDEHDYSENSITPPSRHHRNRPPPIDNTSTILVAKASVAGRDDLRAMKAFRLQLFRAPSEVFGSPDDPFVQKYGVPECLDATLHVGDGASSEVAEAEATADALQAIAARTTLPALSVSSANRDDSDNDSAGVDELAAGARLPGLAVSSARAESDVDGGAFKLPTSVVAWTKIALGMVGLLVLSSMLFATVATAVAHRVSQAYAVTDDWATLDSEAPEL